MVLVQEVVALLQEVVALLLQEVVALLREPLRDLGVRLRGRRSGFGVVAQPEIT